MMNDKIYKLSNILNIGHDLQEFLKENDTDLDTYNNGPISTNFYFDFKPLSKNTIGKQYVFHSKITKNIIDVEKKLLNLLSSYCELGLENNIQILPLAGETIYISVNDFNTYFKKK